MKPESVLNKNTFFAGIGGFQYGYNSTVIAGALLFLTSHFSLSIWEQGVIASIVLVGAFTTSLFAGILGNRLGRRLTMMLSAWCFLLGITLSALAPNFWVLLAGRFIVGCGAGIITTIAPLYLAEIASPEKRGRVVNLNQIGISVGALVAYLSGFFFSSSGDWRGMFAMGLIPALIQTVGLFFIPETYTAPQTASLQTASWKTLFLPEYRTRILLGATLCALQQITGINAIFFYTPSILQNGGFSSVSGSLLSTVGIGVAYVVSILLSFWLVDKVGRRPLILWSVGGMVCNLLILSFIFWSHSPALEQLTLVPLLFIILFYAVGIGPIPQLVIAEICPVHIRGHAMTFTGFVGWISNFLVTLTFLDLSRLVTPQGTFFLYATLGVFGLAFLAKRIPETKQKSFEEIEKSFEKEPYSNRTLSD